VIAPSSSRIERQRRDLKLRHVNGYVTYWAIAVFAATSSLWNPTAAQEPAVRIEPRAIPAAIGTGSADRLSETIRVNSDLVLIPVMVTDRDDRAISGLERGHFRLWEDKTEQTITHFAAEDAPISVVFAFDVSGSMGRRLKMSRLAVDQFLRIANREDEFAVVTFSDQAHLLQHFTTDGEAVQNRLLQLESKGRTALLDAIVLSMNEMKHAKNARKVILIVSDGGDNSSRYSVREVRDRVREGDVQIYSIGIEDPLWLRSPSAEQFEGAALLNDVASQSGGRLYEIHDANDLPEVAARIGKSLRNQYVLGYVPDAKKRDGKYHRVQVKVQRPQGVPRLRASFRTGYIAASN
jgi:VWFA-related protein